MVSGAGFGRCCLEIKFGDTMVWLLAGRGLHVGPHSGHEAAEAAAFTLPFPPHHMLDLLDHVHRAGL